jgi:hypothetical protein
MFHRGEILSQLGHAAEARRDFDEIVARNEHSQDRALRQIAAVAAHKRR